VEGIHARLDDDRADSRDFPATYSPYSSIRSARSKEAKHH
jgi:hypothetical protein